MPQMIVEAADSVLQGTDAALPLGKPATELVLSTDGGIAPAEVAQSEERIRPMSTVLARIRAQEAAAARGEAPAEDAPSGGEPAADVEPEPDPAAAVDPAAPAAKAADAPDVAALRAESESARAEAAAYKTRLAAAEGRPGVTEDEQRAYITDPLGELQRWIANRLGLPPDHKEVEAELAHHQQLLTNRAIGDTNLSSTLRAENAREQSDRRWRLDQQVRATERVTANRAAERASGVQYLTSIYEAGKDAYPEASLGAVAHRKHPAEIALDLIPSFVERGLIKPDATGTEIAKEALRLTNLLLKPDADKIRAHVTAPAPAKTGPPGATPAAESKATGATRTAAPRTLSAPQAAAAPPAAATNGTRKRTIVEIDPSDRHRERDRTREIAERIARGKK